MSLRNEFYRLAVDRAEKADGNVRRGERYLVRAQQRTQATENRRMRVFSELGSDAQADPSVFEGFTSGLSIPGASLGAWRKSRNKNLRIRAKRADQINSLYKRSFNAAKAGNHEEAARLRDIANKKANFAGLGGYVRSNRYGLDPITNSPSGKLAGSLLRDAAGLLDRDSESAQAFKDSLTEGAIAAIDAAEVSADRRLATDERTAYRQQRDFGLARGSSHSSTASAAVAARTSERFGAMRANVATEAGSGRAQVHAQAAQVYEQYSRSWAVDALGTAMDFVNGAPFIRDSYVAMRNELSIATANLLGVGAQVAGSMGNASIAEAGAIDRARIASRRASRNATMSLITGIASIAVGALTFGVGGAVVAGLGSTATTLGKSNASYSAVGV